MAARWWKTRFIPILVFLATTGCIFLAPQVSAQAGPIIAQNFPGITFDDTFSVPPDSNGAAGPSSFVEFVNGAFAVYNKTGSPVNVITDTQFWSNAGISPGITTAGLSDPRIVYDPSTQRWFASEITIDTTRNSVLVARSNSSDPTAGWKAVNFIGNAGFADFDTLGLDAKGVYIGTDNFTSSSPSATFTSLSFFSIPKSDITASTLTLMRMTTFGNLSAGSDRSTLQGAIDLSGPSGVILATDLAFGTIDRRTVIGAEAANATLSSTTKITGLFDGTPILARQPDGTKSVDTVDDRFGASVYQVGDTLYAARTISDSTNPSQATHDIVHWVVLNAKTNAVVRQGTISDPNFDFFDPSIVANANGDVVLAFNRSGGPGSGLPNTISSFAQVCRPVGGVLACDDPFLLRAGEAGDYHLLQNFGISSIERWGDYSTTTIDPNDPFTFWTIQEIPMAFDPLFGITTWETWITEISLTPIPEPSTLALVGLGLFGLGARHRGTKFLCRRS